eukprot:TRINITY_DN3742_c0_g1_i2.p1 TRINITY_DN3742_c0_g1~~TRINITY_DN3742_c0_g1_i2.p1  ORF type:complete len:497 (+),score=70.03 TRINITY_DN3742_c0_g1_i2:85-1575(+)
MLVLLSLLFGGLVGATADARPNIIWVMADDLGWGEVGLYPSSSPHGRIATPNLDQFGRDGMVFMRSYAGYTVCAPSRTTFFTGRHSGQFVKHGLDGGKITVSQNVTTVAQLLQRGGYRTGAFGKVAPLTSPLQQGFDIFKGQINQAYCHNMYPQAIDEGGSQLNFNLSGNFKLKNRDVCMQQPHLYNYTIDVFHDEGMAWLESVASGADPFFLYLSFTIPHAGGWGDAPQTPEQGNPVPTDLQYADKQWPDVEKDHAAVITYLDGKVGDLLERLKRLGIDDRTLVFFASDNGAHLEGGHSHHFFDSTGGLPGHKRSMYEGGVRSPTMARWPSVIRAGSISNFSWAFWDVLPTLAELAGADVPPGLDGVSIVPTLRGQQQSAHEYMYFTWVGDGGRLYGDSAGKRFPGYTVLVNGRWKGMVPSCANHKALVPSMRDAMRLFDLDTDPFETKDIAKRRPHIVKRLKKLVISQNLTCMCFQCPFHKTSEDESANLMVVV